MNIARVDRTSPFPAPRRRTSRVEDCTLTEQPRDYGISCVRRYTGLVVGYALFATFGIDQQTREQASEAAHGAIELALDTAAEHELLDHQAARPLMAFLHFLLAPHAARAAAAPGAVNLPAAIHN